VLKAAEKGRSIFTTVVLVDVSGSMTARYLDVRRCSGRMQHMGSTYFCARSARRLPYSPLRQPRRSTGASGFALRDAIDASQRHNGTCLGKAVEELNRKEKYDRLIVITDEQAHDTVPAPNGKGYVINVASNKNGVGYGKWTHIDGWSESVIEFIRTLEQTPWIN